MGIFAKALDISIPQLIEMSSAGSLLAEEVLPKVAKQLKIDYSGAAKGAEGFSISLTRLQNIGMEMSIKLVNAFGGLFSFVVDIFSNIASAINAILDDIIKIFSSFVIGVTATLGVGLVFLLKMNPVKTFLMNISGLLTAGIAALMGALGPFFLGILADVLDDFLGAQKTLMQNMYEGVSNGILWFLSSLDSVKRKITGKGLFDTIVGKPSENPFKSFIDGIGNITKVIPSGVIELLALVLMFEQLITLTKHFGMPMFKGLLQGLNGIRVSLVGMKNEAISPKGIQSLFTNTFDLSAQVESKQRSPIGTRLQDEIAYAFYSAKTTIATQMKGLWASFTGFFKQLPATIGASAIFGGFIDGISATKAAFAGFMANITAGFKAGFWQGIGASFVGLFQLVGNGFKGLKAALNFAWTQGVVGGLNAIGASLTSLGKTITSVGIIKAFTLLFSSDGMLASSARAAWGQALSQMLAGLMKSLKSLAKIGIEAGIALAFMFLARSDFSNPMQKSISEMARSVNGALGSISNSLAKVDEASKVNQKSSKELAKGYKNVADSIPSKGLQLDIVYVFGMKEEGYTTDDFVKNVNKALRGEIDKSSLSLMEYNKYEEVVAQREGEKAGELVAGANKTIGFGAEYATDKISPKQKAILKKYDIKGLISDTDYDITLGVKQVIDNLDYFDSVLQSSKKEFGNLGLTKETQNKYKARVKDVADRLKQIDIEVLGLSVEKSKATQQNTPESKKRAADLSKQIVQRLALRKELAKDVEANANSANVLLEEAKKLEDAAKTVPAPVRGAYLQIAKEMKDFAQEAKQIIEKSAPVNPLEQVYKDTLSALNRFQAAYDRFSANIDRSTALREERIYSSGANPGDVDYATRRSGIISQEQRVSGLSRLFTMRKAALDLLSTIPDSNLNTEAKDKITELRKQTQEDATSLATARSSLAKSRYDLKESLRQQQKQVDDYVRSVTKEIDQGRLEIKKANQEIQNANFKTKINEALTGLGDTEFTRYIDGLVSIIEQLNQTALSQIDTERTSLDFKNRIKDSQIEARELIRTLPSGKDIIGVTEDIESDMKQAFRQSSKELEALINAVRASAAKVTQQTQQTVKESGEANKNTEKLNENMIKTNESVSNMNVSLQQTVDLLERSAGIKIDPYSNATPAPSTPTNNSSTSSNSSNSNGVQGVFSSLFSFFGASQNASNIIHPVAGNSSFTSGYGMRRGGMHKGVDYAAPIGTPVVASFDGKIKTVGNQPGGWGKYIEVQHLVDNKKLEILIAHLDSTLVTVGQQVKAGQQIATVGNTGYSTGPHAHIEIKENGIQIDPAKYINSSTKRINATPSTSSVPSSAGVNTGAIADSQKQREEILKQQDEANKKRAEALRKQNEASVIRNLDNFFRNTRKTIRESRDSTNSLVRSFSNILNEYSPDKLPDPLTPESIKLTDTLNQLNDTRQDIQERLNSLRQSFVKGTDGKLTDTLALFNPLRKGLVQKKEIEERIKLTKAMSRLRREYENRSKIRDSDNVLRQAELDISQKGREIGEYSGGKIELQEQADPKFSIKRVGTIDFTTPEQQKGYLEEIFQKQKTERERLEKERSKIDEMYLKAANTTDLDVVRQYNIAFDKLILDISKFNQSVKENAKLVDELRGLRLIEELKKPTANPNEPRFNNLTELMKPRSKFGFGGMDEYKLEGNTYFPVTQDSQIQNSFSEGLMPFNQMQLLNIRSVPELQFEERKLQIEDALSQYELNTKELVAKGLLTSVDAEARIEKYREITRIKRIQNQSQLEIDKANETKTEVDRRFERRDLMNSVDYNFSKSEFASRRYEIEKATALREAQINASVLLNEEQRTDLVRKNQEMQTKLMTDLTKDIKQTVIAMKQETAQTRLNIYRDKGGNQFQINAEQRRMDEERLKKEKQDELDKAKKEKEGGDIDDKEYEERTKEIEEKYKAKLEESKNAAKDVVSTIRQMVRDSLINDLSAGLTDVIMGVQKLDDVLNNLAKNMLNGLINIAIKSLMQSLVGAGGILDSLFKSIGGIFGGNSGGEVPSANDGGEVSSQYKGGVIKNYAGGGIIQSLNEAIVREKAANGGITPVVAVLTPGERVLSVADNAKFQSMGLDKAIKNNNIESVMNYAMGGNVSNSELKVRNIMNFASGGVIPPSPGLGNINQPTTNTTVNVPITIESQDGDKSPSIDPNAMQSAIKTAVIVEIQRQQRQGGILKR
jgi:murein DD-endopeptidase MepM/ murein hydrolase activator NlpD